MNSVGASQRAIINPAIDLLTGGLLSMLTVVFVLSLGLDFFAHPSLAQLLTVSTIINGAHFMASYRMLYFSRGHALQYRSSSFYMPLLLIAYGIWALAALQFGSGSEAWVQALLIATALYLAVHYTGQTWGMMASYAVIEGKQFAPLERKLYRASLRILMVWQMVWSLGLARDQFPSAFAATIPVLSRATDILAFAAFGMGAYATYLWRKREGALPPARVLSPYLAIYCWYAFMARYPAALALVQFFHCIQYLGFPARVEINRFNRLGQGSGAALTTHLGSYAGVLLFTAVLIFVIMPYTVESIDPHYVAYSQVIIAIINIHHFYIDGDVWRISNPVVKQDLFSHLPPRAAQSAAS